MDNALLDGFIVHAWQAEGKVRLTGRLADGRSFACLLADEAARIWTARADADAANALLKQPAVESAESFEGRPLSGFRIASGAWSRQKRRLEEAGLTVFGEPPHPAEDALAQRGIRGAVHIRGKSVPGKRVDLVFHDPELTPGKSEVPLKWLALDIETRRDGCINAVSLAVRESQNITTETDIKFSIEEVLFAGPIPFLPYVRVFATEAGLLKALVERIREIDPDVITGWNVIDFDLHVIASRCAAHGIAFSIGRTDEPSTVEKRPGGRTRVFIAGRQTIDTMQLVRGSGTRFEDQTLDTVAAGLLSTGKTVHLRGEDKLAELERLHRNDPAAFCNYCLDDSRLVLRILSKTGLDVLTVKRAALTGVGLDLAWTSIPTFERIYAIELAAIGVLPLTKDPNRPVSGAAGGMVLPPLAGLFRHVLVFDFRSLYPSIMRTFNIDPLSQRRAEAASIDADMIIAPNSARFLREDGILPRLIGRYFAEREAAQKTGDETAAYVYKILMNSFYGVLGSDSCRYGRTELAGAITSFGRQWLEWSRDFFEARGYRVLYGDTDSVFVETALPGEPDHVTLTALGGKLAAKLNTALTQEIATRYKRDSFLSIRCEKAYSRFLIPRMRLHGKAANDVDANRGRAKGYAGLQLDPDGDSHIEVKGMEAARSDWTPLARRFQTELLALVFGVSDPVEIDHYIRRIMSELRAGLLDGELIYRKSLRRPANAYEHMETPQVRAARLAGWTDRRGSIDYYMTTAGAEPVENCSHPMDYEHYLGHQLQPIWDSIADAAMLISIHPFSQQMELEW